MIRIGKPYIEEQNGEIRLISHVTNDKEGKSIDLYYSVDSEYSQYLCNEQADAFVLPMLLRAVITGQCIEVDAPLSEKLLHNIRYGVVYALKTAYDSTPNNYGKRYNKRNVVSPHNNISVSQFENGYACQDECGDEPGVCSHVDEAYQECSVCQKIEVKCTDTTSSVYGGNAVGTGCSLGVDSLSVIKKYFLDESCLPSYRITHFACFNVGAFGSYNTDATRKSFHKEVSAIKDFGARLGLPVVAVDTNLHEFFPERDFNWSHSFLNMGCVLALQKLWGKYLYASGYSLENFKFDICDSAKYEPFLLPNLSTESTELIPVDMEKSRSAKVRFIMDDPIAMEYLNVCLKEQSINDGIVKGIVDQEYRNCGHCEKCMRTMLQLDIYGKLGHYSKVFDLSDWERQKKHYLAKVLACQNENLMYHDIVKTIPTDYQISFSTKLYSFCYKYNLLDILRVINNFYRKIFRCKFIKEL